MKIPLHMDMQGPPTSRDKARTLEHDVLAAKGGDWNAKQRLANTFLPLLRSLAEKRSQDNAEINRLLVEGKRGLLKAAEKYSKSVGGEHFQVFALDYIAAAMDGKDKGFFAKLFGSK